MNEIKNVTPQKGKENELTIIKGFKGFNKDFKCRKFPFEVGKSYEEKGNIKACSKGFHFCEHPLDVFGYYPPSSSKFCEVEGSGKIDKDTADSKVACSKITIKAEIGLSSLINSAIKFVFEKVKWTKESTATGNYSGASATGYKSGASATGYKSGASATGDYSGASTTGNYSGASAIGDYSGASAIGDYSGASATGNCSGASATGNYSGASAGKGSVALATGMLAKAKGDIGAYIVISECEERNNQYYIIDVKCTKVDGENIKPDTWYRLINGEFVEVDD